VGFLSDGTLGVLEVMVCPFPLHLREWRVYLPKAVVLVEEKSTIKWLALSLKAVKFCQTGG